MAIHVEDDKLARVLMLKSKYADTISKAQKALSDAAEAKAAINFKQRLAQEAKAEAEKARAAKRISIAKKRQETKALIAADSPEAIELLRGMSVRRRRRGEGAEREEEAEADQSERERKSKRRREEIERQREAARIAVESVTKTVDFDNLGVMRELQKLIGKPVCE